MKSLNIIEGLLLSILSVNGVYSQSNNTNKTETITLQGNQVFPEGIIAVNGRSLHPDGLVGIFYHGIIQHIVFCIG